MTARILPLPLPQAPAAAAEDPTLTARALAGDRDAWSSLIARHDHRVMLSLLARGIRPERARELAQETWLRLFERQQRGELAELSLPGLAIVQAGFLAADDHRSAARREPDSAQVLTGAPEDQLARDVAVDERIIRREELAKAAAALATCPPSARRVFELLYENPGLSHAAAAARLGLSTQRVTQVLCEVRKRLRAALGEGGAA